MALKSVVILSTMTAVLVVAYLVMRVLAIRYGDKRIRKPRRIVLGLGATMIGLTAFTLLAPSPDSATFSERIPGPARGTGSVTREISYQVNDWEADHAVELQLLGYPETKATGVLPLRYRIVDPSGKELVRGEQQVSPGTGIEWLPARFSFLTERDGSHRIIVEIPQEADMLSVQVKAGQ